jgi:hypothetical protein
MNEMSHFNKERDEGNERSVTKECGVTKMDNDEGTQTNQVSDTQQRRTDKETVNFCLKCGGIETFAKSQWDSFFS